MSKGRGKKKPSRRKAGSLRKKSVVLESTSAPIIRAQKAYAKNLINYHWDYYSELAGQRKNKLSELLTALREASTGSIELSNWQRAVKWKYSNHPLSAAGSLFEDPGGRFNVGDLNPVYFPMFPALYLAKDKDTAIQELLCQDNESQTGLSNMDYALTKPDSITVVSVSFKLERYIDLRNANSLRKFASVMKNFFISKSLKQTAKRLNIAEPEVIKTARELINIFLASDWRAAPMLSDIPSNSQIFGQLVHEAGIDGIVYPSKMTKKEAVAIFTRNFENSGSWVKLDDPGPSDEILEKIDSSNWQLAEKTFE